MSERSTEDEPFTPQERERVIRLSKRDSVRLLELIDNPPPPNEKLARALEAHRRMTAGDPDRAFDWPPQAKDP